MHTTVLTNRRRFILGVLRFQDQVHPRRSACTGQDFRNGVGIHCGGNGRSV